MINRDSVTSHCSYPLSPLQQGMLYHWLSSPHSGVDVEQLVIELPERIDPASILEGWNRVTALHAALRTSFHWDGEVVQQVHDAVVLPFTVQDWTSTAPGDQEKRFVEWLQEDRRVGFVLDVAPLQRVNLIQLAPDSWRLVWTFHHAILDGRSFPSMLREAFRDGSPAAQMAQPTDSAEFRDHIAWLQKVDHTESADWWKQKMSGFTAPTPLVVNRVGNCESEPRQADLEKPLPAALTKDLRQLAQFHGVTLNTILQAAWGLLLSRYSGESEVVFGGVRACRKSSIPGADEVAGLFINTLPVRASVDPDQSLGEFLASLRQQWVEMRPHEHTPLNLIQSWSGVPGDQQLFSTAVNFEGYDLQETMTALGGAWSRRRLRLYEKPSFPLTLVVHSGREIKLLAEYDNTQFSREIISSLLGHLEMLLTGMAENPQAQLRHLPLLTPTESKELVIEWNPPAQVATPEKTLQALFEERVAADPDAVAVTCDGMSLTYAELNRRADSVATCLRSLGVVTETIVGLCLERSADLVVALLGILKAGAAYLPIDLAYPPDRLAFMLEDAKAPVFLTQRHLADRLPAHSAKVVCLEDIPDTPTRSWKDAGPDQLCYVLYTSGSTGLPKGCCVTHRNITRLFTATHHWFGFNEQDVWTLFHSTAFDFSVWELWGALLYGGRLVVVPFLQSRSPEDFLQLLASERVTVLNQTPSAFRQLIAAEDACSSPPSLSLRYVVFGGEALEMQSLKPWYARHGDRKPKLVNMYGITETTVHVTYRPLSAEDLNSGSVIGVPIPDLQVYILDPERRPVPVGVPGEMYVGGAGLARGYLNRPELTADRFLPDHLSEISGSRLYKTGDLARFLPGRDIEYLGRIDHQVKIRGFRIELGEIENVLCSHPAVRESAVLPREDTPGDKRLCAYLVCSGERPSVESLRSHLKAKLPDYMVPAAFVFLDKFPITNNGKLDRRALPAPQQEREGLERSFVAPRNDLEHTLAGIWAAVLKLERVGIHDNFFEIGGDSILIIHMIAQARKAGLQLTPRQLFEHQSIAALAEVMANATPTTTSAPVYAVDLQNIPLLPVQQWFFEQKLADSNYWNQAFLFNVSERLSADVLRAAVQAVISHHEALRLRFVERDRWIQSCAAEESSDPVFIEDVSALSESEAALRLDAVMAQAHHSLSFGTGPLLKVAYLDYGDDRPGRVFLAAHHLAVDGVSWSILLHDLERACRLAVGGEAVRLPEVPFSFGSAAVSHAAWAKSPAALAEASYWMEVLRGLPKVPALPLDSSQPGPNSEESVNTHEISLTFDETQALLQQVPAAYKTRINDVLVSALLLAFHRTHGHRSLALNLEGHGREELFGQADLSRTVGWFTAIFPMHFRLPDEAGLGATLMAVKEELRSVPQNGAGYGALKYSGEHPALVGPEPDLMFNYLGRLDQITDGSELFSPASESTQPWHSPAALRRHRLEIDSWVLNGRFVAAWKSSRHLHRPETISCVADAFLQALREIIQHCVMSKAGVCTPSDFPHVPVDQATLDRASAAGARVADVFPLSPMQSLFFSAASTKPNAGFDQWRCQIHGPLDVQLFRAAWAQVLQRHAILRASFHSPADLAPVQVVLDQAVPEWAILDWRDSPMASVEEKWRTFLLEDSGRRNDLSAASLSRFTIARMADQEWRFVWSVPDIVLDGWSWPVVFGEVAEVYRATEQGREPKLEPARSYGDFIAWLREVSPAAEKSFWQQELADLAEPTPVPVELRVRQGMGRKFANSAVQLSTILTEQLTSYARRHHLTPGAIIQAAWGLLLARGANSPSVTFGAAFSGRPAEFPGVHNIVGPFVNNLPVRLTVNERWSVHEYLREVQQKLFSLSGHQFTSMEQMQDCSSVPWSHRLFESLVVFQNYQVDDAMCRLGRDVEMRNFDGPIHTNYPLTLIVTPAKTWEVALTYLERACSAERADLMLADLQLLLDGLIQEQERSLGEVLSRCRLPQGASLVVAPLQSSSAVRVAPRTEMERKIAAVWERAFGHSDFGVEDNFFDLGGQSLLMIRVHKRLCEVLERQLPIVQVFAHPTISALAQFLSPTPQSATPNAMPADAARNRAAAARAAMARARSPRSA